MAETASQFDREVAGGRRLIKVVEAGLKTRINSE
jgi:hypothetical protein